MSPLQVKNSPLFVLLFLLDLFLNKCLYPLAWNLNFLSLKVPHYMFCVNIESSKNNWLLDLWLLFSSTYNSDSFGECFLCFEFVFAPCSKFLFFDFPHFETEVHHWCLNQLFLLVCLHDWCLQISIAWHHCEEWPHHWSEHQLRWLRSGKHTILHMKHAQRARG